MLTRPLIRLLILLGLCVVMVGCMPKAYIESEHSERVKNAKIAKKIAKLESNENNPRCAFRCYYERALQQDPYAQYMVSLMFLRGVGVPYSLEKSVYWYSRAQKHPGNALAKYQAGKMLLSCKLFNKDELEALKWITLSAKQGCIPAQNLLGDLYHKGGDHFDRNDKRAYYWYTKSAEQGNALGQYSVGLLHYNGQGIAQDRKLAAKWFKKAAVQGAEYAQFTLARMYQEGTGLKKNNPKAYGWWSLSPEQRFEETQTEYRALVDPMTPAERAHALALSQQYKRSYVIQK